VIVSGLASRVLWALPPTRGRLHPVPVASTPSLMAGSCRRTCGGDRPGIASTEPTEAGCDRRILWHLGRCPRGCATLQVAWQMINSLP
jgi:hypothetical protein